MDGKLSGSFQSSAGSGGGGTVTAVTGVAPIASSGGATPAISVSAATSAALGVVKPDGTIITVAGGAITVPKATNAAFGVVEVDGTTITAAGGVISAATATSAALGIVKPDGTIITVAGGAITVPKATSAAFGVVEVDGTTITAAGGVISAAGGAGLVSGACFLLAMPAQGVSSNVNWENTTLTNAWSGLSLNYFPASGAWKIKLLFTAGSPQIGNMVILRTAINSLVVIDSTSVTIGGVSNPTLVTPGLVETDAVALALDNTHNYYFMIFFSNVGANSTVGVAELFTSVAYAPVTSFDPSGNQTGVGTISNASSHANVGMLGLYVP